MVLKLGNNSVLPFIQLFVLLIMFNAPCYSQDQSFSQFSVNNLYFNPAYVGSNEEVDILVHYRRYLTRIPSKFESMYASIDYPFNKGKTFGLGGMGLIVFQDTEGDGYLKKSSIGIPFSVQVSDDYNLLQFGIMPSIALTSINWDNFIFGNQINPYSGYDPSIAPPPTIDSAVNLPAFPDFSFGTFYKHTDNPDNPSLVSKVLEAGIAFHHWPLQINQSFTNGYAPLPLKIVGIVKYTFPVDNFRNKSILIQPSVILEIQGPMNTAMISTKIFNESLLFGFGFRKEQSETITFNNFTFECGYSLVSPNDEMKRSWIILCIDVPVKSQYAIVNTSYEISLNFKLPDNVFKRSGDCGLNFGR
jgi:type IX secretion system PorP/SprF family membrane protein